MFRTAYAIARQYTAPAILSRLAGDGKCSSSIGAYVVVNDEGWVVTAAHITDHYGTLLTGDQEARALEQQREAIANDATIGIKERKRRLAQIKKLGQRETKRG